MNVGISLVPDRRGWVDTNSSVEDDGTSEDASEIYLIHLSNYPIVRGLVMLLPPSLYIPAMFPSVRVIRLPNLETLRVEYTFLFELGEYSLASSD